MTDTEKLIQIEEEKERLHKEYLRISKSKESKAIVKAIKEATNNTFVGGNCSSTLLGWLPEYDKKGRLLNADPNRKISVIYIEGYCYSMTTRGWHSEIWEVDPVFHKRVRFISYVDFRPRYIKIRDKKKAKENEGKYHKPTVTVKTLCHIDDKEYVMTTRYNNCESGIIVAPYIPQEKCETIINGTMATTEMIDTLSRQIIDDNKFVTFKKDE